MDYEHVTVVLEDEVVEGIEVRLAPDQTIEDWVEQAVADRHGDGETVDVGHDGGGVDLGRDREEPEPS